MKNNQFWAIKLNGQFLQGTFWFRRDAIENLTREAGCTWGWFKNNGYSVAKVIIKEIRE